jgi:hypothetical protein
MPVFAVYIVPSEHELFYQVGTSFLGYDIHTGARSKPLLAERFGQDRMETWLGKAPTFGFHATIGDALEYPDSIVSEVELRLHWIARRIPPFSLVNGRFLNTARYVPHTLTATFDASDSTLDILHYQVVTMVNVLYSSSPFFEPRRDSYPEDDAFYFIRYGVPHYRILDKFDVHFSFATGIPDLETWEQVRAATIEQTNLFSQPEHQTLQVNEIHLVQQHADGFFRVVQTFPLDGQL